MKYALVNGERQEAQPKLPGNCICCNSPVIAKCGTVRVRHWSHKGKLKCDPWWENETAWHRNWKNCFPREWQEVVHFAASGEKHIADVKTDQGMVIEFQHSSIKSEECESRENFYKNMIWIVDGTRRLRDKSKFILAWQWSKIVGNKIQVRKLDYIFGDECALVRDWTSSKVPVFFDLGDILYGLLPKTSDGITYAFEINRNLLIECLSLASQISFEQLLNHIIDYINNTLKKEQITAIQAKFPPQRANSARYNSYSRFQSRRHRRL